ncbi:hypothetical protein pdam_00017392 [Pocillopora damicornis]|uniref:Uncharacterized protein n=1 Tax=Pocillopora damicornis TaxID=46731 RepID=A0A3M6ULA5_POCDA|nr:hypothetical protein pdam_00017392 [Pocillopora damicornis]
MASESDCTAKDLRHLSLESVDEANIRKRKRDSCSRGASSKRTRAALQEKTTQMSVQPFCSTEGSISGFSRIETRSQRQSKALKEHTASNALPEFGKSSSFTFSNYFIPVVKSVMPLPELDWADPKEVWAKMLEKERKYSRDPLYFRKHSFIQPRMRAILLDWLTEVCEVYRLHRETYYLAVDFVDRYLSVKHDIAKQRLQLVGTTALFIAAKMEEIYPPKISEFAYVTDGACTENEILHEELLMLKLLDLCILDVGSLQFSYSILAASALYHMLPVNVEQVTGHSREELHPCIQWMTSFAHIIMEKGAATIRSFEQVQREDAHNIQTHAVDIASLDKALALQSTLGKETAENRSRSPNIESFKPLTPPSSTKKPALDSVIMIE